MMSMHLCHLLTLICTITVVLAVDPQRQGNKASSITLIQGEELETDKEYPLVRYVQPPSNTETTYVYSFYSHPGVRIEYIEVSDEHAPGNDRWPLISEGGIRNSFVEIRFSNNPGFGVNFNIKMRTNVQARDIRQHITSSIDSEYNLIDGVRVFGDKLIAPVRVMVVRGRSRLYSYDPPPNFIITRFEVLDDNLSSSHGCMLERDECTERKKSVAIKCKTRAKADAYFIFKVYLIAKDNSDSDSGQPGPSKRKKPRK